MHARGLSPRLCLYPQSWHCYYWPWKKMSGLTAGPIFPSPSCIWLMITALFPCMPMGYFITNKNKFSSQQFFQLLVRSSWATNLVLFHPFFCNMWILRVWELVEYSVCPLWAPKKRQPSCSRSFAHLFAFIHLVLAESS